MSANVPNGTRQWFWMDDLARLLVELGYALSPPLDEWLAMTVAIRAEGEPLTVAKGLLENREGNTVAA